MKILQNKMRNEERNEERKNALRMKIINNALNLNWTEQFLPLNVCVMIVISHIDAN